MEDTAHDSAKKRIKVNHTNKNENDNEVDDEVEFVDEHIQDVSAESEFVRPSKENVLKVEPSFNDVLKHFRWENRSLKSVSASQYIQYLTDCHSQEK